MKTSGQGRLLRYALRIAPYNIEINYKPGKKNKVADFLSRLPWPDHEPRLPDNTVLSSEINVDRIADVEPDAETSSSVPENGEVTTEAIRQIQTVDVEPGGGTSNSATIDGEVTTGTGGQTNSTTTKAPAVVTEVFLHNIDKAELKRRQEECPETGPMIFYLKHGELPLDNKRARSIALTASQYYIHSDDVLYHIPYNSRSIDKEILLSKQLCVPISMRAELLESKHAITGHAGGQRLYLSLLTSFYWNAMFSDAKNFATSCKVCQQNKISTQKHKIPLKSIKNEELFNIWSIDILKTPKSHQGNSLCLICVENFSLWPEATPLKNETAPEIANALVNTIFARHGIPAGLLSDQASNLTGKVMTEVCRLLKIKQLKTATYRAQSDPAELQNKMVLQTLRCMADNEDAEWENNLCAVLLAHRCTASPTRACMSPYKILYGRDMSTPEDLILTKTKMSVASKEYLSKLVEKLELAHRLAKEQIKLTQEQNKKFYDRDAKMVVYPIGSRVWLRTEKVEPGRASKLMKRYSGPYYVTLRSGNTTYYLRECNTNQPLRKPVNADRLKLVIDRSEKFSFFKQADEPEVEEDKADEVTNVETSRPDVEVDEVVEDVIRRPDAEVNEVPDDEASLPENEVEEVTSKKAEPAETFQHDVRHQISKQNIDTDANREVDRGMTKRMEELIDRRNELKDKEMERSSTRYNLRPMPRPNMKRKSVEEVLRRKKSGKTELYFVRWEDQTENWVLAKDVPEEELQKFFIARDQKRLARKR
jgi:hypothetical protein